MDDAPSMTANSDGPELSSAELAAVTDFVGMVRHAASGIEHLGLKLSVLEEAIPLDERYVIWISLVDSSSREDVHEFVPVADIVARHTRGKVEFPKFMSILHQTFRAVAPDSPMVEKLAESPACQAYNEMPIIENAFEIREDQLSGWKRTRF